MIEGIYRNMIEDSEIAYLRIRVSKTNGKYKDISILDNNKAYKKLVDIYEIDTIDFLENDKFNGSMDDILNKVVKNKKYSFRQYLSKYNLCLNLDVYYGEDDEFHLRISDIGEDYMKISSITRNSPFLAWIKDKDGIYIDCNNKFKEIVSMEYHEIIGKNDYEIWPKSSADTYIKEDQLVRKTNMQYSSEDIIETPTYGSQYFQVIKWPFRNRFNEIIGTIGIAVNINDTVKLKESIEKNERILQEISNNIEDVIIMRDDKKALYISNSFEKIFGFNPERLYEDISEWHKYFENIDLIDGTAVYDSGEPVTNTQRIKKGKFDKWITSKFVPVFDKNGNIIKKIGIITDITKKKKLEENLESLRMDLFANLSHEIRTPITLILSCIQLFTVRIDEMQCEGQKYFNKYISIMRQNSYRLLKLVNNLIDTTKIDSGNFNYKPENYDIVSFVEDICMSVSEFVKMNNMTIVFDTDEEEKIISFDLDNMERIILNLLSNAIKYNNQNGNIEVSIRCSDSIEISIKDNGIGIPKDKQQRVFERFGQVKNKLKTEHEGSGIGLFLVKSLVELNGGNISLNSQLGKGSEFIISLPNRIEDYDTSIVREKTSQEKIDIMNIEFSDIYI